MGARILLLLAHPYPRRSRAGRILIDGVRDLPNLDLRSLYELYPDFDIDVPAEQAALSAAGVVVWHAPLYWYGPPAMLSLWFEKVLARGWAYGKGGRAVAGKIAQWTTTTGAPASAYAENQPHGYPFASFVPPVAQTARFCGMEFAEPIVVHDAHRRTRRDLEESAARYRARLVELAMRAGPCPEVPPAPLVPRKETNEEFDHG